MNTPVASFRRYFSAGSVAMHQIIAMALVGRYQVESTHWTSWFWKMKGCQSRRGMCCPHCFGSDSPDRRRVQAEAANRKTGYPPHLTLRAWRHAMLWATIHCQ